MNKRIANYGILLSLLLALLVSGCGSAPPPAPDNGNGTSCPFAGNYAGTYQGYETGTFTLTINPDCSVEGSGGIIFPPGDVIGTAQQNGQVTISATYIDDEGPCTVTFTGTFQDTPPNMTGSGSWHSSCGESGTWSCTQVG